jgi:hypothetical protein
MNNPGMRTKSSPTRANNDHGAMAQLVAHLLCKQGVRGSSPLGSTLVKSTFRTLWRSELEQLQQQTAAVGC